jgi:hypothetical protein
MAEAVTGANASRQQRTSLGLSSYDKNFTYLYQLDVIEVKVSSDMPHIFNAVARPEVARVRELINADALNVSIAGAVTASNSATPI